MEKPKIAQNSPFVIEVEAGKYAWCSCGQSSKQPYCDGSHKGTSFTPIIEQIDNKKTVAWCGCKNNVSGPFCDGSHAKLK